MSHDAQHRGAQPLVELGQFLRGQLYALGYTYQGDLLSCAECGPHTKLYLRHDLLDGQWAIGCERCDARAERDYSDPIRAVGFWNARQLERANTHKASR